MSAFAQRLLAWFATSRRDLPWRRDRTPYRVVVSELMLQQTTVAAAIPHYERFLARFPDWSALARADAADVLAAWAGLGYYRRARNLHALAQAIVSSGADFPRDMQSALALPGVGPYTAGAVLSLAHGIPAAAVDGNVARVLSRHRGRPWLVARARDRREIESVVLELQPNDAPGAFNESLMELGATTCTPRAPACLLCPVASDCVARNDGRIGQLPPAPKRAAPVEVAAAAAVIEVDGRVLLRRRAAHETLLARLWELPGGWTSGEDAATWLRREVLDALGGGEPIEEAGSVRHAITTRRITVALWRCRLRRIPAHAEDLAWVLPAEAASLGLTAATSKALRKLHGVSAAAPPSPPRARTHPRR